LAAADNDVTLIARGAHLEAMRSHGLGLDSELGALHVRPVLAEPYFHHAGPVAIRRRQTQALRGMQ
jgi:2-dehydropantoate 2-reductase